MATTTSRILVMLLTLLVPATASTEANAQSQLVRFDSNLGKFDIALTDNTPLTNANFLSYVDAGDYDNTYLHRLVRGFVIQGGGFTLENNMVGSVPRNDPVTNEPFNNNVRGTIALAKLGASDSDDPENSGTNQFFFNLGDNRANLDNQNGGFTAFGNVTGDGLDVIDALSSVLVGDASQSLNPLYGIPVVEPPVGPFLQFPLIEPVIAAENFLLFSTISRVTNALGDLDGSGDITAADVDLLFAAYGPTPENDLELDIDSSGQIDNGDRNRLIEGIAETSLGDLNFDQRVDILNDAFTLVNNLGLTSGATYAQGDINGDGAVDVLTDAFVLIENVGFNGQTGGSAQASASAVPEPGAATCLALAMLGYLTRRERRPV